MVKHINIHQCVGQFPTPSIYLRLMLQDFPINSSEEWCNTILVV